jgi:hypothetical protein
MSHNVTILATEDFFSNLSSRLEYQKILDKWWNELPEPGPGANKKYHGTLPASARISWARLQACIPFHGTILWPSWTTRKGERKSREFQHVQLQVISMWWDEIFQCSLEDLSANCQLFEYKHNLKNSKTRFSYLTAVPIYYFLHNRLQSQAEWKL